MNVQTAHQPRAGKRLPRPEKFFLAGLLIDLLFVVALLLLIGSAPIHECGRTFSILFSSTCTLEDLSNNLYYIMYYGTIVFFTFWWLIIPVLLIPPFIGYTIGKDARHVKGARALELKRN